MFQIIFTLLIIGFVVKYFMEQDYKVPRPPETEIEITKNSMQNRQLKTDICRNLDMRYNSANAVDLDFVVSYSKGYFAKKLKIGDQIKLKYYQNENEQEYIKVYVGSNLIGLANTYFIADSFLIGLMYNEKYHAFVTCNTYERPVSNQHKIEIRAYLTKE